ncbi:MAG: hypothetical protein H6817_03290 [Phycisphaerales bacterium]|nr:hypothetical protein [Phycisphaerales bacterium]
MRTTAGRLANLRFLKQPDTSKDGAIQRGGGALCRCTHYVCCALVVAAFVTVGQTGCAPAWKYSYIDAERTAADTASDLLICYRDHLDLGSADLEDALKSAELAPMIKNFVRCSLVSAYAPNRAYMAQFGVTSPPGVVVVHSDGTYHALTENLTPDGIRDFLASAKAPGSKPQRNTSVPRPTDYLLRAEGVYETAVDRAQRLNRNLLIVYKWWLDEDSTKLIARMSRPEVAAQCTNTVNCVLDWDFIPNRGHVAQYGVQEYPAIIIVHRDGTSDVLQGLAPVDRIIGFLDNALGNGTAASATNVQLSSAKPGWRWSTEPEFAANRARDGRTGLFMFFHSATQDESVRAMRLLQSNSADTLLADTVRCSVDAAQFPDQLAAYNVDVLPACVGVRPDGTSIARQGNITFDDLTAIRNFLEK